MALGGALDMIFGGGGPDVSMGSAMKDYESAYNRQFGMRGWAELLEGSLANLSSTGQLVQESAFDADIQQALRAEDASTALQASAATGLTGNAANTLYMLAGRRQNTMSAARGQALQRRMAALDAQQKALQVLQGVTTAGITPADALGYRLKGQELEQGFMQNFADDMSAWLSSVVTGGTTAAAGAASGGEN